MGGGEGLGGRGLVCLPTGGCHELSTCGNGIILEGGHVDEGGINSMLGGIKEVWGEPSVVGVSWPWRGAIRMIRTMDF